MRLRLFVTLALAAGSTVAVSVLDAGPAAAAACTFDQVTHGDGFVAQSAIDGTGDLVAFTSTNDLTGENDDENIELFLFDATAPSDTAIDQLTDTSDSSGFGRLHMDTAGDRITFLSTRNFVGTNADLNTEVFLFDRGLDTVVQLTNTFSPVVNSVVSISGDGNRVAYTSTQSLVTSNPDGNGEIFLRTLSPNTTVQVTNTTGGGADANTGPRLDGDGDRLAFESTRDLVPGQNPSAVDQLFVRNLTTATTTQLTTIPMGEFIANVDVNDAGTFASFRTGANIGGGNPEGNFEYYRTRVANGATAQLSDLTQGKSDGVLNGAGNRVAFLAEQGAAEGSGPFFNLWTTDVGGSQTDVTQTSAGEGILSPSIDGDGTRIAFVTSNDLIGQNSGPSFRQLFVATCGSPVPQFTDVPRTNPFFEQIQWMTRVGVAQGFPNGTFRPLDPVKRQQMANFLYNLVFDDDDEYVPPVTPTFSDVPTSNPFYREIEWMVDVGVASGFPNGTFRPDDPVKRQQMANFLHNLAGNPPVEAPVTPTFTDVPTSNPFFADIEWMAAEDIAQGFPNGTFLPLDPVKRQQMANFVFNFARVVDLEP